MRNDNWAKPLTDNEDNIIDYVDYEALNDYLEDYVDMREEWYNEANYN